MNRPTETAHVLSDADLWHGGHLEVAIVLGPRADSGADARLVSALRVVWSSHLMFGPYVDRFGFGPDSRPLEKIGADSIDLKTPGDFYGWMELPSGRWSIAGTCVIREEFGDQKFDWLDVYLPLAGLAAVDERVGGYPFGDTADCRGWLKPVSARLGQIGCAVVDAVGGTAGFVGFEVSGTPEADGWDGAVPAERNMGYVAPNDRGFADYFAPTEWR